MIREGNRIFAPSLGNFIFDQMVERNRITAVLRTEINDGVLSFEYLPYYMSDLYQPVPSPEHGAYLREVTGYLEDCCRGEGPDAYDERIRANVSAGHRRNRIAMRTRMLSHFWDYLPYAGSMLSFMFRKESVYSVIKSSDDITGYR